jgi:import inner membrane translocase subunit TIM10
MNSLFGRPQPSSAEKIAAVEQELKLITDLHQRYGTPFSRRCLLPLN